MKAPAFLSLWLFACLLNPIASAKDALSINIVRSPNESLQPLAQVDEQGVVHLIYFKGDASHGDLFYVQRSMDGTALSEPVRVNQIDGAAMAIGTIRGAHVALGRDGRLHVAWMGSKTTLKDDDRHHTPMLYTRSLDRGKTFEKERNVIDEAYGLDGGGSLAADQEGNVMVVWHAGVHGGGESVRRIWTRLSNNDGESFGPEKAADDGESGVCGCCGLKAYAAASGSGWNILYRSATERVNRDMYLLASSDGQKFTSKRLDEWKIEACPMSSAALIERQGRVFAAWETKRNIAYTTVPSNGGKFEVIRLTTNGEKELKRKHPAMAIGEDGSMLLCWTEDTGWKRGGSVHWQLFDPNGQPTGQEGMRDGLPAWSKPTVVAEKSGGFLIVF